MSILKSPNKMNGQSFGDFWINASNVLKNMEIKQKQLV